LSIKIKYFKDFIVQMNNEIGFILLKNRQNIYFSEKQRQKSIILIQKNMEVVLFFASFNDTMKMKKKKM